MSQTVYFADKTLIFTSENPGDEWYSVVLADGTEISRTKVTKILESHNRVAVVTPDPDRMFDAFAVQFKGVEAAGGVVVNDCGEWLMIYRNGRWDLPKGHLEAGESIETCAAREVEEETGVAAEVVRFLCRTAHAYFFPKTGCWELKRTHWYQLHASDWGTLVPQTEEGIEQVAWCAPADVSEHLRDAFPTIRRVAEAMRG